MNTFEKMNTIQLQTWVIYRIDNNYLFLNEHNNTYLRSLDKIQKIETNDLKKNNN